jgi:hypothetical protein
MARRRGLGSDGEGDFSVLCYFTRVFSNGVDEVGRFHTEADAMKFAKKCVKGGHGSNPHALVNDRGGGPGKIVQLTRAGRLQVKKSVF